VLVVIGGLWEALLARPLEAEEVRVSQQLAAAAERLEQLDRAMTLAAQGIGDGMGGHVARRQALLSQIAENEDTVRVFTSDLVDPAQMRHVLEELIDRQRGLTLIRASNLEVMPLIESADPESGESDEPMLFRHGLRLELEGSYLDFLDYLGAVERLPWRLYWGTLSLNTQKYPRNEISIEIFTLSLDKDWIGV
jgi:MSHA biogenesis protein MshJ